MDEKYPLNEQGTCAFQSSVMLLTYFDTYYSDNIVSANHTQASSMTSLSDYTIVSSPGVESISYGDRLGWNIRNNYSSALELTLLKIADDYNYIDANGINQNYGIKTDEQYDIINYYLNSISMANEFYILHGEIPHSYIQASSQNMEFSPYVNQMSSSIRNTIVSYVSQGYPVIASTYAIFNNGTAYVFGGHSMIAYDYDLTNTLIFHGGYNGQEAVKLYGDYIISGYIVLIPKSYSNHVCSSNYNVGNSGIGGPTIINWNGEYYD